MKKKEIKITKSSGNVFADLGLSDSEELLVRSQIGYQVYRILKDRKLKQSEMVEILGIKQPEVSHLMNGHFHRFTTEKLLEFLRFLNKKVRIGISDRQEDEPYQEVFYEMHA